MKWSGEAKRRGNYVITPNSPTEQNEQRALVNWLEIRKILYCHVPNGGKRNPREAAIFKTVGVKPGVPDIIIWDSPPLQAHLKGVAIELKRQDGGSTTGYQKDWLTALEKRGWACRVCHGAYEAIKWLQELGYGK